MDGRMIDFVEEFLLLTTPQTLIAALNSGDYSALGLTLKAEPRKVLNDHLLMLHRNMALKMKQAGL